MLTADMAVYALSASFGFRNAVDSAIGVVVAV